MKHMFFVFMPLWSWRGRSTIFISHAKDLRLKISVKRDSYKGHNTFDDAYPNAIRNFNSDFQYPYSFSMSSINLVFYTELCSIRNILAPLFQIQYRKRREKMRGMTGNVHCLPAVLAHRRSKELFIRSWSLCFLLLELVFWLILIKSIC